MLESRTVPTVTLAVVLNDWLGGRDVAFLHVDVQGGELDVLKSAGAPSLRHVERMVLEVPSPHCVSLTRGAPTCDEVFATLDSFGFASEDQVSILPRHYNHHRPPIFKRGFRCLDVPAFDTTKSNFTGWCEADVLFVRKDVRGHWRAPSAGR